MAIVFLGVTKVMECLGCGGLAWPAGEETKQGFLMMVRGEQKVF